MTPGLDGSSTPLNASMEADMPTETHRCTACGETWAAAPLIDENGMHTDPHGDGCAGPIEFTPPNHGRASPLDRLNAERIGTGSFMRKEAGKAITHGLWVKATAYAVCAIYDLLLSEAVHRNEQERSA